MRNNGGIIGRQNIPALDVASGVWGLREQLQSQRDDIWPFTNLIITNTTNLQGNYADSSYTFSSADLGSASDRRHIIIAGTSIRAGGTGAISSVTIGGVSGTVIVETTGTGSGFIAIAKVPSGATGDIVVTYGVTVDNLGLSVFAVYGSENVTSVANFTSSNLSGSQSITTVDGGILVGIRMTGGAGTDLTLSWTDSITGVSDTLTNGNTNRYISSYSQTKTSSETVSWSTTGSPSTRSLVVASFQP